jgi:hypothetical protein
MKTNSQIAIVASLALLFFGALYTSQVRTAVAAPPVPVEQYRVVSVAPGRTDAQVEAGLNALAAEGWRVRCSTPGGIILAR